MDRLETLKPDAYPVRCYLTANPNYGRYGTFYGNNPKAGRTTTAKDGAKLYFEVYGEDPKRPWAVCVHAAMVGFPADFAPIIDELLETHNVIVPLLRGHGASELTASSITTELLVEDLIAILTSVTDQPADFCFSCISTVVGFALGADHPELVRHLNLYGGCAFEPYPAYETIPHASIRRIDPTFFAFFDRLMGEDAVESLLTAYGRWISRGIRSDRSVFSRIHVPTYLMTADHDPFFPLAASIEAYRYIRGARFAVWPGEFDPDDDTMRLIGKSVARFFSDKL